MKKIIFIALLVSIILSPQCKAGWLDESIYVDVPFAASAGGTPDEGYFFRGGELTMRFPTASTNFVHIVPPKVNFGCGGIDTYWGSFSMLGVDRLVQMGQTIIANAPGFAFDIAMKSLCEKCSSVMNRLSGFLNQLNKFSMDTCSALKDTLGPHLEDYFETKINQDNIVGNLAGSLDNFLKEHTQWVYNAPQNITDFFNDNNSIDDITKHLIWALGSADNERHVIFWEVIKKEIIEDGSGINSSKFPGAARLFQNPNDYVNFLRYITGDFDLKRGKTGQEDSQTLLEKLVNSQSTEPATLLNGTPLTSDKLYHPLDFSNGKAIEGIKKLTLVKGGTDDFCSSTETSSIIQQLILCDSLPGVQPNPITIQNSYDLNGIVLSGNAGLDLTTITINQAITGGSGSLVNTVKEIITNLISEISQTGGVNAPSSFGDNASQVGTHLMQYQAIPIYPYLRTIGMMSIKYPSLQGELQDSLAKVITLSYGAGILIEVVNEIQPIFQERRSKIEMAIGEKNKENPAYAQYLKWLQRAQENFMVFKQNMYQLVGLMGEDELEKIRSKLIEYYEAERKINIILSNSAFANIGI